MMKGKAPGSCLERIRTYLKENLFVALTVSSVFFGIGIGIVIRRSWTPLETRKIAYLKFPGDIFLSMLRMVSLPLIVSSIVSSVSTLKIKTSGRVGVVTILYYLITTFCAVITGIVAVILIHPGRKSSAENQITLEKVNPVDSFLDMIRNAIPENLVEACLSAKRTVITEKTLGIKTDGKNINISHGYNVSNDPIKVEIPSVITVPGTNIIGLIVFSIFIGCILSSMGTQTKPVADFFSSLYLIMMRMISIFIWFTPVGLLFLIAASVVQTENPEKILQELAIYIPSVIGALLLHGFGTLSLFYFLVTRKNPLRFVSNMSKAIITAFGTNSSSATLPITMDCLINKNHVDGRVVNFLAPIGATVNMDGTALFISMFTIFIAQRVGVTLSPGDFFIIGLTAIGISIGSAAIPGLGLVTMSLAAMAVGLPLEHVLIIAPIDWMLERFRTIVNVAGDSFGTGIVEHLCLSLLKEGKKCELFNKEANELRDTVPDIEEMENFV